MTHSEVRVTIHSHCRHKNLDTYKYIHNNKNSICSSRFDFVLALHGNSSCSRKGVIVVRDQAMELAQPISALVGGQGIFQDE